MNSTHSILYLTEIDKLLCYKYNKVVVEVKQKTGLIKWKTPTITRPIPLCQGTVVSVHLVSVLVNSF